MATTLSLFALFLLLFLSWRQAFAEEDYATPYDRILLEQDDSNNDNNNDHKNNKTTSSISINFTISNSSNHHDDDTTIPNEESGSGSNNNSGSNSDSDGENMGSDRFEFIAFLLWYIFLVVCCVVPTCCAYRRRRQAELRWAAQQANLDRLQHSNLFLLSNLQRHAANTERVQEERKRRLGEELQATTMVCIVTTAPLHYGTASLL